MYVYQDTNANITFKHPYTGAISAEIYRGSTLVDTLAVGNKPFEEITIALTYKETQYSGQLRIEWHGDDGFHRTQFVDVVTPIAPLSYIESALTEAGAGETNPQAFAQKIAEMENTVRLIIEAYTGRSFTSYYGMKSARGVDGLTKLLDEASRIESISPPLTADLSGTYTYLNIKQAPPEEYSTPTFDGVIRVPKDYYRNTQYTVTGFWGQEPPAPVQEAALILVQELSCNETLYRDRYLQVVSYADSRFQFNSAAYRGTGNVKADQLLEPYKRGGMIIV